MKNLLACHSHPLPHHTILGADLAIDDAAVVECTIIMRQSFCSLRIHPVGFGVGRKNSFG